MEDFDEGSASKNVISSRRDEIRHAAEAILNEERRAALDVKMRQKKMRLLTTNTNAR
jgi:hypothetical protein